ncbi:ATP-binding protein [Blastochloris sulfoviridis]|uniref:ATP-binding protein n=1 Tax=Blastochloris sulfoviridis TaxID=50712 RepID=A0A5M6I2F0_9HYPH|nr:ATP-binding protein [Blastochloris sulfoviridis]KAA5602380.1 ATP-binding protein [Blastochloris sulfoviridis]
MLLIGERLGLVQIAKIPAFYQARGAMGRIHESVRGQIQLTTEDLALLNPFLVGFDVSWGRIYEKYNAKLKSFIIKPEQYFKETFGVESEVALFISEYQTIQDRTIQAASYFLQEQPALGRVDQSLFFMITPDPAGHRWISDYQSRNPQSRTCVVFLASDLNSPLSKDGWFIRNNVAKQLFTRDLFDYQLPIDADRYFFGREQIVQDYIDAIRKSQNRGLFGLRKTGKTSTLLKIKRICEDGGIAIVRYYDCKIPSIRSQKWDELLWRIICDIEGKPIKRDRHISDLFLNTIKNKGRKTQICLIFDEIEFISPISPFDEHWKKDFVDFWQTLWSTQSQQRSLSFVISGVNPYVAEQDKFSGGQNPIFGIVKPFYMKGFEQSDVRKMVRFFGKRMGLDFDEESINYLHTRYGGHPLLIRMACSYTHSQRDIKRPIKVGKSLLIAEEENREAEMLPYCRHVVSEIRDFYPDEYELLELLATRQVGDYWELSSETEWVRHIKSYGIVSNDLKDKPKFEIPVLEKYISSESRKRTKEPGALRLISASERSAWARRRLERILSSHRSLETLYLNHYNKNIWPNGILPEADKIITLEALDHENDFSNYIMQMYKTFVEPVYKRGIYSFEKRLMSLQEVLDIIRVLRHSVGHANLTPDVQKRYDEIKNHVTGRRVQISMRDLYCMFQQYSIDQLFVAFQIEIQKLG